MRIIIILLMLGVLVSCENGTENETEVTTPIEVVELSLNDTTANGAVKEWYPGRKQIKFEGNIDKDQLKHGAWHFYNDKGEERSLTTFNHGKKHGHTVVYYPNGGLHYKGEYKMDSLAGEWKFYLPDGTLKEVKNY